MSWLYLSNPCAFLLPIAHGAAGAVSARLFLRPLSRRERRIRKPRAKPRRENESACLSTSLRAKRPVYAYCASYAGLGVRRSSESEGGSNPAFLVARRKLD